MLDKIDYFNHKTYNTPYYLRQYEHDLPEETGESSYTETAKRAALIALPFLSLYQPLGKAISLGMGATRVITHGIGMFSPDLSETAKQAMQVALAVLALIATLFNFTLGLYITTAADIITNLIHIVEDLSEGNYDKAGAELLQAISSAIYLAIMMTGSLEVVLASVLIQAIISLYQAREEWEKGRLPEAFAKTIMGMVRIFQAGQQVQVIQRRNVLLERYQDVAQRVHRARAINHLWDHPFIEAAQGQKGVMIEDAQGNAYDFGSNFHGTGKQIVKGMNVTFNDRGDQTTLDFKVNHVFRDRLEKVVSDLSSYSQEDIKDLLQILGSHATHISVTKQSSEMGTYMGNNENYEIDIGGVGKISLGASKEITTLYDKMSIQMEKGKTLYDFHEALAFLNLDDVLRTSTDDDIERMKLGYLFRFFKPQLATPFERSDDFFDLSTDDLKKEIQSLSPEMRGIFEKYLPKLELREILPGRMRFAINGLADELKEQGVKGLTAALTGVYSKQEMFERTASIFKMGMIASELRRDHNVGKQGLSSGADYFTGGADSVFTQLVTDKNNSFDEYMYTSDIRFLISPKVLETGTYQYHCDNFGTRVVNSNSWWTWLLGEDYLSRDNIFKYVKKERSNFSGDGEVMAKERIPPELFKANVPTAQYREELLDYLRSCNVVQRDQNGNETINSIPVYDCIYFGKSLKNKVFV